MSKHLNPLEKEFLIRQYKSNTRIKMRDFCEANHISTGAFQKWIKQYDEGGLEGLARADSEIKDVLPEGIDRTEESYKREILKLRIENERLKKNYVVQTTDTGEQEFIRLRPKNSKSWNCCPETMRFRNCALSWASVGPAITSGGNGTRVRGI